MDLKALGKKVIEFGLPTLGAALAGPSGALIGKALAQAIGSPSDAPTDILATLEADAKAKAEALRFQQENALALRKLDVDEYRVEVDDRNGARSREVETKDGTTRLLAYLVVGSFIGIIASVLFGWAKVDSVMAGTLVGYLSAKAEQVIAYYFGSTSGSRLKTLMLGSKKD